MLLRVMSIVPVSSVPVGKNINVRAMLIKEARYPVCLVSNTSLLKLLFISHYNNKLFTVATKTNQKLN